MVVHELVSETYRDIAEIMVAAKPSRPSSRTRAYHVAALKLLTPSSGVPIDEYDDVAMTPPERGDLYADLLLGWLDSALKAWPIVPKKQRQALERAFTRAKRLYWALAPVADVDFEGIWAKG